MQIPNQYGEKKDEVPITRDEMRKIEGAMKRPEFQELLGDYMKEISDPKNREEYDQYLRQLETESELPKGLQLVKPEPHYCLKTSLWSKANKKHVQKFFVNVCATSVVGQPFSEDVVQNGQQGKSWKIPFTIGKIRYDQDKKGDICNTVDVAFHPLAIGYINKFPGFQNILCETALDAAQKQLGERNEDISKDYKILKRTKCKGGEPALLPVRVDKKGKINQYEQRQGGLNNAQTKLQKDILGQQKEYQDEKGAKLKKDQTKEEPEVEDEQEEQDNTQKESNEIESDAVQQPKHKYIYSYPVDYSDFLDHRQEQVKKRPNVLGLDIYLPKIKSVKEVSLDIAESTLILDAPKRYYLNIKLPYPIISSEGTAKFDSKTKQLKIRAPINPQYLKERALQDVEDAKKHMVTFVEETENDQNPDETQSKDGYTVSFLPSQETQDLSENIAKVELLNQEDVQPNKVLEEKEDQIPENEEYKNLISRTIYNKLTHMQSLDNTDNRNFYVMIKIKNYKIDQLQYAVLNQEIILKRETKEKNRQVVEFIHLKTPIFVNLETKIQFVTDFVVIKLHKDEPWQKDDLLQDQDYTSVPFTQFIDQLSELQKIQAEIQKEKKDEIADQVDLDDEQTVEIKNEEELSQNHEDDQISETNNNDTAEIKKDENDLGGNITIPYDKEKITINFIDFKSVTSLAYDID